MNSPTAASAMRHVPSLDHVGLFARDMDTIAAQYERLGFRLTPLSQHSSLNAATGVVTPAGSANRCAMLRRGYIELLAIVDPTLDPRGLAVGLARYAGLHIMAFRTEHPEAVTAELREQGFSAVHGDLRRVIGTPDGPRTARFSQVRTPPQEMPEGTVFMLKHETPDLLWQAPDLVHPNGAAALAEVCVVVPDAPGALATTAARYARFFGCDAQAGEDQVHFTLTAGRFTLLSPAAFARRFPGQAAPVLPFPAAFVVEVDDLSRTESLLRANGATYEARAGGLHVAPVHAGGCALEFRPPAPSLPHVH